MIIAFSFYEKGQNLVDCAISFFVKRNKSRTVSVNFVQFLTASGRQRKNMPQTSACMFSRPYYRRRDSRSVLKNISEKTCHQLK